MKTLPFSLSLASLSLFGLSLLTLPSQNRLIAPVRYRPGSFRRIEPGLPSLTAYPLPQPDLAEPYLTATAAAVFDRRSGVFLFRKNAAQPLLPASTVKVMTALVSLDHYSLLDVLLVSQVANEGQDMKLIEGEPITVEALLYGLLVSSANDAALVLAQNYPGGEAQFIEAMNQKAAQLHLKNSSFANPTGLDNGRQSASSAQDLAWLTNQALKNPTFAQIVSTKKAILQDPQKKFFHPLYNLNELLWDMPEVKGVKTGWTESARECLITFVQKDNQELIFVVLGSEDRFGETRKIIDWVFKNYSWEEVTPQLLSHLAPPHTL